MSLQEIAVVTDIQRSSFHDGPGIRTTVFFKGCPLHCAWCHNPECIKKEQQILFYPEKCIGCKMCEKGCFAGARVVCGRQMTAEQIFAQVAQDKEYYGTTGGITFSGGEPLLYPDTVGAVADCCKRAGIGTAMETSLYIFNADVLRKMDFVMADFKIFDRDLHIKYTGVDNAVIKEHFGKLDSLGIPFLVRTPVIPGINDTVENIRNTRDYIKNFKNIVGYELLPYHALGVPKQRALGLEEVRFEVPTDQCMEELRKYADIR